MKRLLVALGVIAALFVPQATKAAQAITITPTSIDKVINPGETLTGQTQVLNQADSPFDYKVYAAPYSVTGEDYDPSFTSIPGATDVASWFKLKAAKTRLDPYSTSALNYTITVPANTKPGGYYAVIFAETESKVEGTGVTTQKRVGTVVYIRVAGDVVEKGAVASWSVPWFQQPNLRQTVRIENTGSVHFAATIKTTVKDIFGNTKLSYAQKRNVLPEKVRRVTIEWEKTPALGIFKVGGTVELLGQTSPLSTKYVLVMSKEIQQGLVILLSILLLIYLLKKIYRYRKAKKKKVDNETKT